MRAKILILAAIAAFAFAAPYVGGAPCGTILDDGATIDSGAAPTKGTVTVDPCLEGGTPPTLPPLGALGTLGTLPGSLPDPADGGTGADGAYHATSNVDLAAGEHDYTSFRIDNGVTVNCLGPVTIRATQGIEIYGQLMSASPITIRGNGDLTMAGDAGGEARIDAFSSGSDIDVLVNGIITDSGARTYIVSEFGSVTLVALGTEGTGPSVDLQDTHVSGNVGGLTILSRYRIALSGATLGTQSGALVVRCYEDPVDVLDDAYVSTSDGALTIESAKNVNIDGDSIYVETNMGILRVASYDGDTRIDGYPSIHTESGDTEILASGQVVVVGDPVIDSDSGAMLLTAFGGEVSINVEGPGPWGGANIESTTGSLTVKAATNVRVGGSARLTGGDGPLDVRALDGDVVLVQEAVLGRGIFRFGPIDVRASGGIDATIPTSSSGSGHIHGSTVSLSAGDGGVTLAQNYAQAESGDFTILTTGPVSLSPRVTAQGNVHVSTTHATLEMIESTVETTNAVGMPSGSVLVESWAGANGTIDATDALILSGTSDGTSGDVTVVVHAPGGGVEPPAIESFVLPKRVLVKLNEKKPEKSKCAAAGFFDTGPDAVDFTKPATIEVGGVKVETPGLAPNASGRKYLYKGDGLVFLLKPSGAGSSRAKFKLTLKRDLTGQVDPSAALVVRFANDDVEGTGEVVLRNGKYKLRKVRGDLIAPSLYLFRSKVKLKGAGKDSLSLLLGLATEGSTPAQAAAVRVRFGESLDVTVPADQFRRAGEKWLFKGNVDGITMVSLDYAKELVKIKGKNLDLGALPEGANRVFVGVDIGDSEEAVRVRMVRQGKSLKY